MDDNKGSSAATSITFLLVSILGVNVFPILFHGWVTMATWPRRLCGRSAGKHLEKYSLLFTCMYVAEPVVVLCKPYEIISNHTDIMKSHGAKERRGVDPIAKGRQSQGITI